HNKVIDGEEEIEVHVPSRTYMKLSLATHERTASGPVTRWNDLILWDPSPEAFQARKGDQIEVTGRREEYEFETAEGETRTGVHLLVPADPPDSVPGHWIDGRPVTRPAAPPDRGAVAVEQVVPLQKRALSRAPRPAQRKLPAGAHRFPSRPATPPQGGPSQA